MRQYKRFLLAVSALAALWLLGQLGYRGWVAYRWHQQEAHFPRDSQGIREGCEAFELPGQAPALLFVHGFADSPRLFKEMAADLSSAGYACHAIRLPGFADSMDHMQEATRTDWLLSLQEELDQLNEEYGSCVIIAHSLGGALALKAFQQNPQNIDGLVLMAPLLAPSRKRSPVLTPRAWFQLRHVLCPGIDRFANVFDMDIDPQSAGSYPRDSVISANIYTELFSLLDELHEQPVSLNTPVLLLQGENDRVVDNAAALEYLKAAGSQVTPHLLLQSGHVIPLDKDREQAMQLITEFLATPPKKGSSPSSALL